MIYEYKYLSINHYSLSYSYCNPYSSSVNLHFISNTLFLLERHGDKYYYNENFLFVLIDNPHSKIFFNFAIYSNISYNNFMLYSKEDFINTIITVVIGIPIVWILQIVIPSLGNFFSECFSYSIINIISIAILIAIGIYLIFKTKNRIMKFKIVIISTLFFTIFLSIIFLSIQTYKIYDIRDKTVVVISEFDYKGKKEVDIVKRMEDSLIEEVHKLSLSSIKIENSSKIIYNDKEAEYEGKKGNRKNAKVIIIIWGCGDDIDIKTSFKVVKAPDKELVKTTELVKTKGKTKEDNIKNFDLTYFRKTLPDNIIFFTHITLGTIFYYEEDHKKAILHYKEAIRINPNLAEAHYNLGNLFYNSKQYEDAEKEYREAVRINPNLAEPHYNLGLLLYDLKRYNEAEKEYRETIRINPNLAKAHYNLGNSLYDLKRYDEAENEYREAIIINPNLAETHNNLGNLLSYLKQYGEAENEYRKAIQLNKNLAETHNNLGILLSDSKRYDEAENEYREAIIINPNFAEAHNNL